MNPPPAVTSAQQVRVNVAQQGGDQWGNPQPMYYASPQYALLRPGGKPALLEDQSDNPCRCCCQLVNAAKIFAFLNLYFLLIYPFALINFSSHLGRDMDIRRRQSKDGIGGLDYYKICSWRLTDPNQYILTNSYILVIYIGFGINWLAHAVSTILFLVTTFSPPSVRLQLLFTKCYMWISFIYPGLILLLLYLIAAVATFDDCKKSREFWLGTVGEMAVVIIWVLLNGLVARGYKNAIQRKTTMQQGFVEAIPVGAGNDPGMAGAPGQGVGIGGQQQV